jgi:glycosyltransferase involved in cell wall biosynthesis
LHLYGVDHRSPAPGVIVHPPPGDSGEAFPPGSILAVPLRIASGVRIKILEAWARGVPVVATPAALAGLEVEDGREALVARVPLDFAAAIRQLHQEPALAASLVMEGRRARRERHDPQEIARRLMEEYEEIRKAGLRS